MNGRNKRMVFFGSLLITACAITYGQPSDREGRKGEPPTAEELFSEFDKNEDGRLSEKEVKGPLRRDFAKIDLNEDGFISLKELKKAPRPGENGRRKKTN